MKTPAPADLQRWSEEVARDPSSLAFLPLARAYRRQGLRAAARQLCLSGLEHYPTHAEAHSLLALLYLEEGERAKAADEWSMVLRMDPNHFEALRGIGFCYLEQDQLSRARQALERAALLRPQDAAVQEALHVLGTRQELHAGGVSTNASPDDIDAAEAQERASDEPWAEPSAAAASPSAAAPASAAGAPQSAAAPASTAPAAPAPSAPAAAVGQTAGFTDPGAVFDSLTGVGPVLGILLLDAQGLVLAGSLNASSSANAEALGATLGPAISEAARTVSHLSLGSWRGMLLEAGDAVLHVSPVREDAAVLLAAKRSAPTGWVLRCAAQAGEIATRYLEEYG